jgi:predicted TIM-barrel fold metal-dependent hydrolase
VYSDDLIRPWFDRLVDDLGGLELFDAHTHTGANDPDGLHGSDGQLLDALTLAGGARAVVFTLHEPDGYSPANDRILAEAAASGGRLVPFCRLDPRDNPVREAERCLDAGARGIKLHPRAEGFLLADADVRPVFALAAERRVPILVHAGRGIPALGRHALELCEQYPDAVLILAHAGISDLSWIWRHAPDHPNLFFDTSWWAPDDLLALFALVPPGQVLFGSDTPYGTPLSSAVVTFRCALEAGLRPEQVREVAGAQLARLLAGEQPADLGPAPGPEHVVHDLLLGRVALYLTGAFGQMARGESGDEMVALARLACDVPDDAPQGPVCRSAIALLDGMTPDGSPDEAAIPFAPGIGAVMTALALVRTPSVGLPDVV